MHDVRQARFLSGSGHHVILAIWGWRRGSTKGVKKREFILGGIAVALLLTAAGLVYVNFGGSGDLSISDQIEAQKGKVYRVHCNACGATFDMPAEEYLRAFANRGENEGVECKKCGARQAFQEGFKQAAEPPPSMANRADSVTREEIQSCMHTVGDQIQDIERQLYNQSMPVDSETTKDLEARRDRLNAQMQWLNNKWDELARQRS